MQSLSYKHNLVVGGAIIIAAVIVANAYISTQKPVAPETAEPTFLYVQTAHAGSLTPVEGDDVWKLTLNDVSPTTVYFSDRPARETGHESTENFIAHWKEGEDSFAATPPNAALDIFGEDGGQSVLVIELMSAAYDRDTNTLVYDVLILDGAPEDTTAYESFGQTALFIDSTYKRYTCGCDIEDGEDRCTCLYSYTLGPSKSKEFQTVCKNTKYVDISVIDRKDTTTCTTRFMTQVFGGDYISKSCTNWSPTKKDEVTVKAICTD